MVGLGDCFCKIIQEDIHFQFCQKVTLRILIEPSLWFPYQSHRLFLSRQSCHLTPHALFFGETRLGVRASKCVIPGHYPKSGQMVAFEQIIRSCKVTGFL